MGFPGGPVVKNLPCNAGDTLWSLVREDCTCLGATNHMHHNSRACVPKWEVTAMGSPWSQRDSRSQILQLEKAWVQ